MKTIKNIKNIIIYPKPDVNNHYDVQFDAIITDEGEECDYELHFDFYDCIMDINMDTSTANIKFQPLTIGNRKYPFTMDIKL